MKKISLKDVKNGLKRDEMRMIFGGSGGCSTKTCSGGTCKFWMGDHLTSGCNCYVGNSKGPAC